MLSKVAFAHVEWFCDFVFGFIFVMRNDYGLSLYCIVLCLGWGLRWVLAVAVVWFRGLL